MINALKSPWQILLVSGLVAACIILVFLRPNIQAPDMEKMLVQAYNSRFIQQIDISDKKYVLPWEKTVSAYGFTAHQRQSHTFRAFSAGLWSGRQTLAGNNKAMPDFLMPGWNNSSIKADKWSQTSWAVYYHMGKWSYLVQTVCSSDEKIPVSFWEKQLNILDQIKKNYTARLEKGPEHTKIVEKTFKAVRTALINLKNSYKYKKYKKTVIFELKHLITYLSLKHSPENKQDKL